MANTVEALQEALWNSILTQLDMNHLCRSTDEILLDSESDHNSYVTGNDRFVDFPEKPAVRERRLIRHEILNGKVLFHDLDLPHDFQFSD